MEGDEAAGLIPAGSEPARALRSEIRQAYPRGCVEGDDGCCYEIYPDSVTPDRAAFQPAVEQQARTAIMQSPKHRTRADYGRCCKRSSRRQTMESRASEGPRSISQRLPGSRPARTCPATKAVFALEFRFQKSCSRPLQTVSRFIAQMCYGRPYCAQLSSR